MPSQSNVDLGRAFEFASLSAFRDALVRRGVAVSVRDDASFDNARLAFEATSDEARTDLVNAARAAVGLISELEPHLRESQTVEPVVLAIQPDSAGIDGDVRDVLMYKTKGRWEIGLSLKHNHAAVKHSRLSSTIDFGQSWLGIPCSSEYFHRVRPIFDELAKLRAEGRLWRDLDRVYERFYVPVLEAFRDEMLALDREHPGEVPARLVQYLVGRHDFYKVISQERERVTKIQAFVLSGTELGRSTGELRPVLALQKTHLPREIIRLDFKRPSLGATPSQTTLSLVCDAGWEATFRIHNASSAVEPSLKFDIQLEGYPSTVFQHYSPWVPIEF